ncbi:MAG: response regulator [Desulfuromusa sp.]|nr:response regulator [Desulfuromusa sp.]
MKRVSLKSRLVFGFFAICLVITLGISIYQISRLQQREYALLQHEISSFEQSALPSIREAVWNYDWTMVETIASSQVNPLLTYIEICDMEESQCSHSGVVGQEPYQEHHHEIYYQLSSLGNPLKIGTTYLQLHYQTFSQLFNRYIFSEFLVNGLGVFGVAICIFLLFHLGVIRRLIRIANYTSDIDLTAVEQLEPLNFQTSGSTQDEVDQLADAIDGFVGRIKEEFTRRKQLEQQLNHVQKMEALGTLAGGIAHDFNNILTAILGYVQLCYDSAEEESKLQRRLEQVLIAGERAKSLIAQILVFSRKSEDFTQKIALAEVITEALDLLHASLPGNVTVETSLDKSLWIVGDSSQLHQVIVNLSTNASYDLAESGGVIKVGLISRELTAQQAEPLGLDGGNFACLTFCDDGSGIADEIREQVFDPFFTTKKTGQGTGMGLAVVHGIVKSHGGTIVLEPKVGHGTCFTLYFPQVPAAEIVEVPQDDSATILRGREHIFLVDDEPVVIAMAQEMLQSLGYEVSVCLNPVAALQQLLETDNIDLLLTDLTMPEMTGIELAEKLKLQKPDIPIILYSGYLDLLQKSELQNGAISRLLYKPFTVEELSHAVRQALADY